MNCVHRAIEPEPETAHVPALSALRATNLRKQPPNTNDDHMGWEK